MSKNNVAMFQTRSKNEHLVRSWALANYFYLRENLRVFLIHDPSYSQTQHGHLHPPFGFPHTDIPQPFMVHWLAHPREYISANGRSLTLAFQRTLQASVHHGDLRTPHSMSFAIVDHVGSLTQSLSQLSVFMGPRCDTVVTGALSWCSFLGDDSILHSQKLT